MFFLVVYLVTLFIAPQLWIEPFVGLRVDFIVYPAWLVWVAITGRASRLLRFRMQDWFFAAMLAWLAVNVVVNGVNEKSTDILQDYVKWFVLYRLTVVTLPTLAHVHRALQLVLFFALVLAIEGIQQMHSPNGIGWAGQGFAWMDDMAAQSGVAGRTRWINIFDGPGVFCVVYTIALPLAMQYLWRPFGALTRLFGLLAVGLLLLATYYTGSRGGFLASVGVVGLFILSNVRISMTRMIMVAIVMIGLLVAAPAHLTSTRDSNKSAQYRIEMWAQGLEMVRYYPVFGIGKGEFQRYSGKLIAHNSSIEIMGETGLPGLFLWLGIIYMGYKNLLGAYRSTQDVHERSHLKALALGIAGYILSAMFVTLEYETFYFLLALAAATGASARPPPAFTGRDFAALCAIMVAFYVAIKIVVMGYY